jgi:hypothetical protein
LFFAHKCIISFAPLRCKDREKTQITARQSFNFASSCKMADENVGLSAYLQEQLQKYEELVNVPKKSEIILFKC